MLKFIFYKKATITTLILFVFINSYTQNPTPLKPATTNEIVDYAEIIYGSDHRLISGHIYQRKRFMVDGHPYFINDEWHKGEIFIKGAVFEDLNIKYNIEINKIILKAEFNDEYVRHIIMNSNYIDSLMIDGHFFVNSSILQQNSPLGFVEHIYEGANSYFIKYESSTKTTLKGTTKTTIYQKLQGVLYFYKDNEFKRLASRKDLGNHFSPFMDEISKELKQNRLRFKNANSAMLISMARIFNKYSSEKQEVSQSSTNNFYDSHISSSGLINTSIPIAYNNLKWNEFVNEIETNNNIRLFYNQQDIPDFRVSIDEDNQALKNVLDNNLKAFNLYASEINPNTFVITKDTTVQTNLAANFFTNKSEAAEASRTTLTAISEAEQPFIKTSTEFIPETIIIGSKSKDDRSKNATIRGIAKDNLTGEPIIGANIIDRNSGKGVVTNSNGYYEMNLEKGNHVLLVSSINIKEKKIEIELLSDGVLDLVLEEQVIMLEGVTITGQSTNKVKGTQMGLEKLTTKSVKKIPLAFGEKDIIKVALLLPGVQTVGEGSAGFNVRGSPTDQNLFYINNVPIYNTSHVTGFFSAFNSDAIDEFSLYKSNIPVNYGGRLSSIFDIKIKQGNKNNITANGGISLITGRILVEGPIKKDKSSFLVGVRSTYSDWAIDMMFKDQDIKDSKANFADAVTNFSFQINDNNLLNVFFYYSYDKMDLVATKTKYDYVNFGFSINWKYFFKQKHTFELSIAHSLYDFSKEEAEVEFSAFKQNYKLEHSEIKVNFNIKPNKNHTIIAGINSTLYRINRGSKLPLTDASLIKELHLGTEKGLESGIYLSDEWDITPKLALNAGIRYNIYASLGPQKVYEYADGLPKIEENIVDSLFFDNNKFAKTYSGLDFRAAVKYNISEDVSIKLSYNRMHQYIYMLSNTIAVSPDYTWKLVDYNTKPIIGDQFSAGFFSNISSNALEVSVEAYYKKVENLVEIKDGKEFLLNKYIEQSTLQGDMKAYGIELMIKKNTGDFTGWINYTYSHTSILVDSEFSENRINYGESYPSNYDKPHAFNLVASYNFSRRLSMSTNVVYSTGRPITYPTAYYYYNGIRIFNYSKRNEYRIPDYFRIDLSFTLEGNLRKHKLAHGSWTFSIYNLLGTNNPYSIYFKQEEGKIKGYKLSIFAAPIFSLTYNFKLGNYEN